MKRESVSETSNTKPSGLNWRGLTSLIITLAILVLATTGVILYVSPQGRVANWTGWTILGLDKEQWAAVHTTTSLLFIITSAFHVYFNWQLLVRYIVLKRRLNLKREMIGAGLVVSAVFAGTVLGIPPFSSVVALNDSIKTYWERQDAQAPYPHAESSTLADFAERTGVPLTVLQQRLASSGIIVNNPASETLEDLARANGLSPNELFARISATNSSGGSGGLGAGLGLQTVQRLCETSNIPLEKALDILQQQGFAANPETTLKALAEEKGISPAEVRGLLIEIAE